MGTSSSKPEKKPSIEAAVEKKKKPEAPSSDQPHSPTSIPSHSAATSSNSEATPLDLYEQEIAKAQKALDDFITRLEDDKVAFANEIDGSEDPAQETNETFLQKVKNGLEVLLKEIKHLVETPDLVIEDLRKDLQARMDPLLAERKTILDALKQDQLLESQNKMKLRLLSIDLILARQTKIFIQKMDDELRACVLEDQYALSITLTAIKVAVLATTGINLPSLNIDFSASAKEHVGCDVEPEEAGNDQIISNITAVITEDLATIENKTLKQALADGNKGVKLSASINRLGGSPVAARKAPQAEVPGVTQQNARRLSQ